MCTLSIVKRVMHTAQGMGPGRRSGHVLRVNAAARTAVVRWDRAADVAREDDDIPQEVSCYALRVRDVVTAIHQCCSPLGGH